MHNFKAVLVRFDDGYGSRMKSQEFTQLAAKVRDLTDILIADFPINDDPEFEQEDSAKQSTVNEFLARLKVRTSPKTPVLYLFTGNLNNSTAIQFDGDFNSINIREFIQNNAPELQFLLPSCIRVLDSLADSFYRVSKKEKKEQILDKAKSMVAEVSGENRDQATYYLKLLQRSLDSGSEFLATEWRRIKNLILGKQMSAQRAERLENQLDILQCIQTNSAAAESQDPEEERKQEL